MLKNFKIIGLLEGVRAAQDFVINEGIDFFPVVDKDKLVGILTYRNLIGVHSNRIVADAMSRTVKAISSTTSLWQAKQILDQNNLDVLLVIDNEDLIGIISKTLLYTELGKHIDLLTGLYKSDYIYYYARELVKNKQNTAIIFIDVNNFGDIDKRYGHIQGDIILKELALLLKNNIPPETYLCRFGGDEFTILAPYHLHESVKLTENLLNKISNFVFSNEISINASAGIAFNNRKYQNSDVDSIVYELINRASLASTEAKKEKGSVYVSEYNIEDKVG